MTPNFLKQNKRPMGHIPHLRKLFKSINTHDYIITLIKRRKQEAHGPYCSTEEDFYMFSISFYTNELLSHLEKGHCSLFEKILISSYSTQGCIVPSLVEIGPVFLEKKILKFR